MKNIVICIDISHTNHLILGKKYKILNTIEHINPKLSEYQVKNDNGMEIYYRASRFESYNEEM